MYRSCSKFFIRSSTTLLGETEIPVAGELDDFPFKESANAEASPN